MFLEPFTTPLKVFCDSRGYSYFDIFPTLDKGQVNIGHLTGTAIKAFHYHTFQEDNWFCVSGDIHVICAAPKTWDMYCDPCSYKKSEYTIKHFYIGEHNPCVLTIPELWMHGYCNVTNNSTLLYWVTKKYNPSIPDEYRINYDIFGKDIWQPENI